MFPSYSVDTTRGTDAASQKGQLLSEKICPLGCLCCIMQQFYNRKCWCKEVKESIGVQTESSSQWPLLSSSQQSQTELVSSGTQTDESITRYEDINPHKETEPERNHRRCSDSDRSLADTRVQSVVTAGPSTILRSDGLLAEIRQQHSGQPVIKQSNAYFAHDETFQSASTEDTERVRYIPYQAIVKSHSQAPSQPMFRGSRTSSAPLIVPSISKRDMDSTSTYSDSASSEHTDGPDGVDESYFSFFCNRTVQYNMLQTALGEIVDKFELTGARDSNFDTALHEIFEQFSDLKDDAVNRKVVREKLRHKISSRRHYERMKSEAGAIGIAVSQLKRRKLFENAAQNNLIGELAVHQSLHQDDQPSRLSSHVSDLEKIFTSRMDTDSLSDPTTNSKQFIDSKQFTSVTKADPIQPKHPGHSSRSWHDHSPVVKVERNQSPTTAMSEVADIKVELAD